MKKLLVLMMAVYLSSVCVQAKPQCKPNMPPIPPQKMTKVEREQRVAAFEKRLELTDEQKQQAKELRMQGHEKMEPVIKQLKSREEEVRMIKNSKLAPAAQEEKLKNLYSDIKSLRKEAHDIRIENMKDFEEILTSEQKKTLKEMRQEGKREYKKTRFNPPREEK